MEIVGENGRKGWKMRTTKKPGEPGFLSVFRQLELSEAGNWCPEEDSNLHASRHTDLNRARLPIPPSGLVAVM
jgi:hypothetical protein